MRIAIKVVFEISKGCVFRALALNTSSPVVHAQVAIKKSSGETCLKSA